MKKLLIIFGLLIASSLSANAIVEEVLDGTQVHYSPSKHAWSVVRSAFDDKITYTKKTNPGTGSYSEYYLDVNKEPEFMLGSNYEFVRNGRLIAVVNQNLKFAEVINEDGKFKTKELNKREIKKLFPDTKIIKISSFKNNEIKIRKPRKVQKYILLNDTDKNFHKYSFNPPETDSPYIKGMFKVSDKGTKYFSHYGNDVYKIIVK